MENKSFYGGTVLQKEEKIVLWNHFSDLVREKKFELLEEECKKILKSDADNLLAAFFLTQVAISEKDDDLIRMSFVNFFSATVNDTDEKKWFGLLMNEANRILNLNKKQNYGKFTTKKELVESFNKGDIDKSLSWNFV